MNMKVYIVVKRFSIIESVWSSRELAKSAILFHAASAAHDYDRYSIIEREVNTTQIPAQS
jgi:hypothetical protein